MPTDDSNSRQPQPASSSPLSLLKSRVLVPALLAAVAVVIVLILGYRIIFAPAKTPPPEMLQTAAAGALQARYGAPYTLALLNTGPALDRPPASLPSHSASSPVQPVDTSPVSPIAPAPVPDGRIHYNATVTARLSETLYAPVDAAGYIANEMKLDASAERKIEEIFRSPGGARIRELAGINSNADSLSSVRLIRETARAGTRIEMLAHIEAARTASGWQVHIASLTPKTPLPEGEPLGKFSGRLIDITRESDIAALRRLITQADDTLRRVESARERYRSELAASAARVVAANLMQLAPGALYTGRAAIPGQRTSPGLCLEIISIDRAASTIRASLRADSSWIDARPLEGRYSYNTDNGLFTIALSAREGLPLSSATGLVVADAKPFRITLQLSGSELSGDTGAWSCKLSRAPDASRAATIAAFSPAEQKLLEATRPGLAYRARTDEDGELLVRFQTQNPDTGALTATIENVHGLWKRELQGALTASPARANGYPLRLLSTLDPGQESAPPIGLGLRLENGNVFKGSIRTRDTRPVTFEPAGASYLAELDSLASARAGQERAAREDAIAMAALLEAASRPSHPTRPADDAIAPPPPPPPPGEGAYILDETVWKPLPENNAHVVRSTLQKVGGVWTSAVSLIKTRPEKQETGTLTFDGTDTPPAVFRHDVTLAFRGAFITYPGTPEGKFPIEIAPLEIKGKGRKRTATLDRLGDAAATFGKKAEPVAIERSETEPGLYIIRVQRQLPTGRYALHAPGHSFEFEIGK